MESSPQAVSPVSPPAAYIGGKRALAWTIVPLLDSAADVTTYAEPFVGMGGVFLRRSVRPPAEVINDRPEVRALFAWASIRPVRTVWTAGGGAGKAAAELLISNWPLPPP